MHVPYRGSAPAVNDLVGGQVDLMFDNMHLDHRAVRGNTVKALGVTTAQAHRRCCPIMPAIAETVPGYEASLMVRHRRPRRRAPRDHREDRTRRRRRSRRSRREESAMAAVIAEPVDPTAEDVRRAHRGGDREVGQGRSRSVNVRAE